MYRLLILTALLLGDHMSAQKSIYDFVILGLEEEKIQVGDTKGKKLLIMIFRPQPYNFSQLGMLDSLQKEQKGAFKVIGVPLLDITATEASVNNVRKVMQPFKPDFPITKPAAWNMAGREEQDHLLQWLTRKSNNHHFDQEPKDGLMYLVNETGLLYAMMGSSTSAQELKKLLAQRFD